MSSFISLSKHLLGVPQNRTVEPCPPAPTQEEPEEIEREREHRAAMNALAEAQAEARAATLLLRQSAQALTDLRKVLLAEVRTATAAVIFEAAKRIAGEALHTDPRLLEAIVEDAVRTLGKDGLVVRINPIDGHILRDVLQPAGVEVVEDFSIAGGCVCEGPSGTIDASVERAVAAVGAVLDQWK